MKMLFFKFMFWKYYYITKGLMLSLFPNLKDSKLDVTIGPYETYEDTLFGYKVLFTQNISSCIFIHAL